MTRRLLLPLVLICFLGGGLALAQTAPQTIAEAQRQSAEAARRYELLNRKAAEAVGEAARARARSEVLVADIEKVEADISVAEARIALAGAARAARRARLAERQRPVVQLASALQTMARRPPALALVQPGSIGEIVRVRALLASTLPSVRKRTAALRADLAAAERMKANEARNAAALGVSRNVLRSKRVELARMEEKERRRSQALAGAALFETDRALAFDEEARALAEQMNTRSHQAQVQRKLTALPAPLPRPTDRPSIRDRSQVPSYRIPVEGRLVTGTGELSDAGVHARGLTFSTAANAPVLAPRGGHIVYAGRFRTYGEIVIIDHGGGWISTITDLAALRVRRDDRVEAGDPIGRARGKLTVELRHDGRPMVISGVIAPVNR
ncbi:MAG: peptidoglycan DD-metalloendopeptidase family protein [Sphingosinicella sp.]|nr:peptidoglycan DD-metalloendopeptidase family protein [Sphingosinicella sp.]